MKRWVIEHGLLLVNAALFLIFLVGTALTGWQVANNELTEHGDAPETLAAYLSSGQFAGAVFENWESEFLQMGAYIVLTVFLFQKGSSETKRIGTAAPEDEDSRQHRDDPRAPGPVHRGGLALKLYESSLLILFAALFVASVVAHAIGVATAYSEDQALHGQPGVDAIQYLGTSQFWYESFQNWQSEFLAVAVLVGSAVYLRQRGSPESKRVAAPHDEPG